MSIGYEVPGRGPKSNIEGRLSYYHTFSIPAGIGVLWKMTGTILGWKKQSRMTTVAH